MSDINILYVNLSSKLHIHLRIGRKLQELNCTGCFQSNFLTVNRYADEIKQIYKVFPRMQPTVVNGDHHHKSQ